MANDKSTEWPAPQANIVARPQVVVHSSSFLFYVSELTRQVLQTDPPTSATPIRTEPAPSTWMPHGYWYVLRVLSAA